MVVITNKNSSRRTGAEGRMGATVSRAPLLEAMVCRPATKFGAQGAGNSRSKELRLPCPIGWCTAPPQSSPIRRAEAKPMGAGPRNHANAFDLNGPARSPSRTVFRDYGRIISNDRPCATRSCHTAPEIGAGDLTCPVGAAVSCFTPVPQCKQTQGSICDPAVFDRSLVAKKHGSNHRIPSMQLASRTSTQAGGLTRRRLLLRV